MTKNNSVSSLSLRERARVRAGGLKA